MTKYYLNSNVKIEPTIWGWYVWPYLIPPLCAACNIVERHLKILQSYVQNPKIHAQAVLNTKMLGGPFVDYNGERVDEIKELIARTEKQCAELITLNREYKEFDRLVQNEAKGDTLESLYQKVPSSLKGMVEIVYDLNSQPSIRLIEKLFYQKYYDDRYQAVSLSIMQDDWRKFVLSTPKLDEENELTLNFPFNSDQLNMIYQLREIPQDLEVLRQTLNIPEDKLELFESFLTKTPHQKDSSREYKGDGVRIRYFGHACILVESNTMSILIDPVISYPLENCDKPRYTFSDLPDHIDYVLITHTHQDHLMIEMLLQLKHKIGKIVFPDNNSGALQDPSIKLILEHLGFDNCIPLREFEKIKVDAGFIAALPFFGEHSDLNIQSKLSYCIELKGRRFVFAADSNNLQPAIYEHVHNFIGAIDILFLGMECDGAPLTWLYGPLLSQPLTRSHDKNRSLSGSNYDKAINIVEHLQCKKAFVYAMGMEPWLNYVMALNYDEQSPQMTESAKFLQTCEERGIETGRLFLQHEWRFSA